MGQMIGMLKEPLQKCTGSVAQIVTGRRKRKRNSDSENGSSDSNSELQTPKKIKLLTTTKYIYQALFKEQKNSDISVMALGKIWHLHKVYLCQSPYFYSMFNGSWKESCQNFVHIKIVDPRITLDALDAAFGSMYSDEIEIEPKAVISVLATATLFQLEGIIEKCGEIMIENINAETAIGYYEASCQYGTLDVKKATFVWLEMNLLCIYSRNPKLMQQINIDLMTALISSPDLYVMQTEFSLYALLRMWMYLQLFPDYDPGSCTPEEADAQQNYFANRQDDQKSFLGTPEGNRFVKTFQALRTQYLTNHHTDLKTVLADKIIPKEWLSAHVMNHWTSILKVDHMPEDGPSQLEKNVFFENCMRCGRVLLEPGYQKWRWTGFNFGLDLVLIVDSRILSIRRHHRNEHEQLLSLQTKRQFMIRVSVTSIKSQRQRTFTQKSDITSLSLEKNEEFTLMVMDPKLVHPLLISVNLLVVTPTNQSFKEKLLSNDEANRIPIKEIGGANVILDAAPVAVEGDIASSSSNASTSSSSCSSTNFV